MSSDEIQIFTRWGAQVMASDRSHVIDANCVMNISDRGTYWIFRCGETVSVDHVQDLKEDVDCELVMSVDTAHAIYKGEITPQQAMLAGRLTIDGEVSKALPLFSIICPGGVCG